ncbi:hypothetical protein PJWF_00077 [Achromobacter phage JWF]|uniref:hypothetical protein n=1 Tax=Achromobacter phage JWF TaxID=1589748 RepID=UPI000588E1A4|nr:hypothetical protein AXJ13_gp111 [Achromobacter phage JWF]AJD82970.1 hypothetical protein PJWF_00077 [Achromobacter phage JWF]
MKLKINTTNSTTIILKDGTEVLFSYETPVAAFIPGRGYVQTEAKYSSTTTRHIRAYTGGNCTREPQEFFDNLLVHL